MDDNEIKKSISMKGSDSETADSRWSWLYRIGGAAALFGVTIILIQLIVFIAWGQPETALAGSTCFRTTSWRGSLLLSSRSSIKLFSGSQRLLPST
jgi:uncharacterized membrane protein YkgB